MNGLNFIPFATNIFFKPIISSQHFQLYEKNMRKMERKKNKAERVAKNAETAYYKLFYEFEELKNRVRSNKNIPKLLSFLER